jgi:Icc-related predicted phosphoesterase
MRILAIADTESQYYYDYYTPGKLDEFDLILACGDMSRTYLEFLISLGHCPVLYVRGNHDDRFATEPPEGCVCVEDRIFVYQGVRILGLGGSYRYRDGANMFTERQMTARVRRLWFQLWKHKGFDILMTHAPARHINDFDSISHRGFDCFTSLLDQYQPRYFVHGHIHQNYGIHIPQKTLRGNTTIINAYDHCAFDY